MNLRILLQKSINELRKTVIQSAELDVQVLLKHVIEKDNAFTYSHPEYLITNSQYSRFRRLVRKRKTGEPIAYLTGHKEFYGYDFFVNKNVLIPRPETEWLVEKGIDFIKSEGHPELVSGSRHNEKMLKQVQHDKTGELTILDMGTGCGNIIISITKQLTTHNLQLTTNFYASDISKKVLVAAKRNAEKFEVKDLIHFYRSDLFENSRMPKKYDLILANLPYVPESDIKFGMKNGILFEPQNTIFAAKRGSAIIEKFLFEAKDKLKRQGRILLEIDPRNADALLVVAKKNFPNCKVKIEKDLSEKNRYLIVQN